MGSSLQSDSVIINFDLHILAALMCLIFAVMIALVRVLIDQATRVNRTIGDNGREHVSAG